MSANLQGEGEDSSFNDDVCNKQDPNCQHRFVKQQKMIVEATSATLLHSTPVSHGGGSGSGIFLKRRTSMMTLPSSNPFAARPATATLDSIPYPNSFERTVQNSLSRRHSMMTLSSSSRKHSMTTTTSTKTYPSPPSSPTSSTFLPSPSLVMKSSNFVTIENAYSGLTTDQIHAMFETPQTLISLKQPVTAPDRIIEVVILSLLAASTYLTFQPVSSWGIQSSLLLSSTPAWLMLWVARLFVVINVAAFGGEFAISIGREIWWRLQSVFFKESIPSRSSSSSSVQTFVNALASTHPSSSSSSHHWQSQQRPVKDKAIPLMEDSLSSDDMDKLCTADCDSGLDSLSEEDDDTMIIGSRRAAFCLSDTYYH